MMKKQPANSFADNPHTGDQQQASLNKGGEVLYLSVSVLMIGVSGLIGDTDRKKSDDSGQQVEPGMGCFGNESQAASREANHDLERSHGDGGEHRVARHP